MAEISNLNNIILALNLAVLWKVPVGSVWHILYSLKSEENSMELHSTLPALNNEALCGNWDALSSEAFPACKRKKKKKCEYDEDPFYELTVCFGFCKSFFCHSFGAVTPLMTKARQWSNGFKFPDSTFTVYHFPFENVAQNSKPTVYTELFQYGNWLTVQIY